MENKYDKRPWGYYYVIWDDNLTKVKKIVVDPKQKLSYQSHEKRAEHWIMIQGIARVTLDDRVADIKAGDSVTIPKLCKHRVENLHDSEPLIFIEVQQGEYFGEDDITRYEDDYGRIQ